MGRSAKVHKRTQKKVKSSASSSGSGPIATTTTISSQSQVQNAKKRATLKDKTSKSKSGGTSGKEEGVLGGADYVSMMMGSRRKAREEAGKLPREEDS